jgi:L-alanine-DL-glutamate epimerase-like enolase superfamily enzyme
VIFEELKSTFNLLISNDPYTGMQVVDGKVTLMDQPGIGIKVVEKVF